MFSWARFLRPASVLLLILVCIAAVPAGANGQPNRRPLDTVLTDRARTGMGESRVIVTFKPGSDPSAEAKRLGATLGRRLRNGSRVMHLSNSQLQRLENSPAVEKVRWDRPISSLPTSHAPAGGTGSNLPETLAYTGRGVGVAIIDSGITPWHDELTYLGSVPRVLTKGGQRVAAFYDYVNCTPTDSDPCLREPYDDYGHGTHVAGIIAGNGLGSNGIRKGGAPEAHLVVAKVLDAHGKGTISDVIDALDDIVANKDTYRIRVVNMSIAAAVLQSIDEDPLADATKRAVDAGIVVVAAAGNLGRGPLGVTQYGGVTAPGNAPWVLTVGAYSQEGTAATRDDIIAPFSSRGPTAFDFLAKPDIVAPGTGISSLADPTSNLYAKKMAQLPPLTGGGHYISLSGTSVAAPAVAGAVAVMVQANPNLTPNLAKAVLQYTARFDPDYDALTQGAGYLNTAGAVQLSKYFAMGKAGDRYPKGKAWSRQIIWGNYMIGGGVIWPNANAWEVGTLWGAMPDEDDDNIVWGTLCAPEDCDDIVWGTFDDGFNIVWGTSEDIDNIVWGTAWRETADGFNIVWGTLTKAGDNLVWGTCAGEDCDNIVWGTLAEDIDNIVWGTCEDCDNIVWGTQEDLDNIVWGTTVTTQPVTTAAALPWTAKKRQPRGSSRR